MPGKPPAAWTLDEARIRMVAELLRSADAHDRDRVAEIGKNYDTIDLALPRDAGPEADSQFIALMFLDGWIDARNHGWQYYERIRGGDWGRLARILAADLEAGRDVTEPAILHHFDFRRR